MSIQFNKIEEEICKQLIEKWYQKEGQSLSHLRLVFESRINLKRHSMLETARLIKTRLEKYKDLQRRKTCLKIMGERIGKCIK